MAMATGKPSVSAHGSLPHDVRRIQGLMSSRNCV